MYKIWVVVALSVFSAFHSVFAFELTFNFRPNDTITTYPCNAGIKHADPSLAEDYMVFKIEQYDGKTNSVLQKRDANSFGYNQIFPNNTFGQRINELTFNFSSDRYGSEYFVDICYHGPQTEYFEAGINANFTLNSRITVNDSTSKLKVKTNIVCDTQGHGQFAYARNIRNQYNTLNTELNIGNLRSPGNGYSASISEMPIQTKICNSTPNAPRLCIVRYLFSEADQTANISIITDIDQR